MNRKLLAVGILAADLLLTLALYARLPALVPVHWGIHGADGFGPRWTMVLLGPGLLAFVCALLAWVERIDPLASRSPERRGVAPDAPPSEQGAFAALMLSLIGLGGLAHALLLLHLAKVASIDPRVGALFGPALLILIGNFLPRVRPNFFAGVRTPWTLSSEAVWRRTNRLAGKLLFFGGLACALLVLAPAPIGMVAMVAVVLASALASILASFFWWRGEQRASRP